MEAEDFLAQRRRRRLEATVLFPPTAHLSLQDGALIEKLRLFDLSSFTPEQCLEFLKELKEYALL